MFASLVLFLTASALAGPAPVGPVERWDYFANLPDGTALRVTLPGQRLYATEAVTGTRVAVYTQAQAARVAAELAIRDKEQYLVPLLTAMKDKGQTQPLFEEAGETHVCLQSTALTQTLHLVLEGKERFATRDDGARVLLFTQAQGKALYAKLLEAGLTIPEIGAVIAGFEVGDNATGGKVPKANPKPLEPECGECLAGRLCSVAGPGQTPQVTCCDQGSTECQACKLCSRALSLSLYD